jgi:hypothetical protein
MSELLSSIPPSEIKSKLNPEDVFIPSHLVFIKVALELNNPELFAQYVMQEVRNIISPISLSLGSEKSELKNHSRALQKMLKLKRFVKESDLTPLLNNDNKTEVGKDLSNAESFKNATAANFTKLLLNLYSEISLMVGKANGDDQDSMFL